MWNYTHILFSMKITLLFEKNILFKQLQHKNQKPTTKYQENSMTCRKCFKTIFNKH